MSYGLYKYIEAKELSGSSNVTYRIELLKNGYSGASEQLEGADNYFEHTYNKINPRNPFENPVQSSQLDMIIHVQGQDELDLLEEIFGADEDAYILQKKIDGSVVWQGKVLNDLLEYDEGDYPFPGRIIAKDLSYLKGVEYPLEENDEKIITTLAGALNELGFGLDIYTYTNWVENNQSNTSDDFLNNVYNDTYAFRNYGSSTEQGDTTISQYDVIDIICRNYNLILRQSNNAWHLFHISALDDPTSVKRYVYNSSGAQQSSSNVDLTISVDSTDLYVLPFSGNKINPAVKKASVTFEHRSGTTQTLVNAVRISNLTDPGLPSAEYSVPIKASGDEFVELSGTVGAVTSRGYFDQPRLPQASYLLKAGQYYWNDDISDWQEYSDITTSKAGITPAEVDTANNKIRIVSNDFAHGDIIRVDAGLATGLSSDTEYYLIDVSGTVETGSNTLYYQLSEEPDGTPVNLGTASASTEYIYRVSNRETMQTRGIIPANSTVWWYDFNVITTDIPSDADGDVSFYAMASVMPPRTAPATISEYWEYASPSNYWADALVVLKNPTTANGDSITYELEQSGNYSTLLSYPGVYFGDGPLDYSRSALLVSVTTPADTPTSQWDFVGGSTNSNFFEIWLKEVLNVQRTARRNLRAELYGEFEAYQVLSHDSKYFFFLGGTQRGRGNRWDADFFEIDVETGSDTFTTIINAQNSAGTGGSGGGTNASTEGISVDFADSRYLQITNNLDDVDDAETARDNLGVEIGADVQAWDAGLDDISGLTPTDSNIIVGDGANWVAESGDTARLSLGVGSTDSPTFAGLTINGNVTISGTVDGRDISDDGADLDELYTTIGLSALTSHEVDQLENIGDLITINNTQWTYLGELDQSLTSNTSVQFNNITLTGTVKTNEIDAQADLIWSTSTEVFSTSDYYVNNAVNIGSNVYITDELDVEEDLRVGGTADISSNTTIGGTLVVSGNSTLSGNLTLSGSADFNSTMNLQGAFTTQNTIQSDNFDKGTGSSGWIVDGATGFAIEDNSGVYDMYVDSLTVRGTLRVFELIAKQISAIGGTEILSVANGVAESVSGSAGSEVVTLEDPTNTLATSFADFDLVLVQRFNPNNPTSLVKQEFRTVSVASGLTITLTSTSGAPAPSDAIEPGDFIVAYGSTTNASTRGNIIYRNVEGQPVVRLQTGINSYSAFASPDTTTRIAYGDLDGFSGQSTGSFGFFAGDDSAEHILIKSDGLFFKDDSTVLAELTSNTFKVGDGTNFLSFDGTDLDIQTDTFTLETTNLSIDSANEIITLGSADSVTLGKKLNLSAIDDVGYRDSLNKYASTVDFYGLYLNPENYFGFVEDDDGNIADGYNFRVGGETSNYIEVNGASGDVDIKFDTFDLTSGNLRIKSAGTTYPGTNTGATSSNAGPVSFTSATSSTTLSLSIDDNQWVKFQFDYSLADVLAFDFDMSVEIMKIIGGTDTSIGFADDIIYDLSSIYAYADEASGATINNITNTSDNSQVSLQFEGTSATTNTGTITFYMKIFDAGSVDQLGLKFTNNNTFASGSAQVTDIDGIVYNTVTELNPNGLFQRLSDAIISQNGDTFFKPSLITNA